MAVEIKHKFQSAVPDGPNTGFVRPSNWNDTHNISMEGERLLGKPTAGAGDAAEIGLGAGLQFSGTNITVTFGSTAGTAAEGNHTHPEATTSVSGFLSALDKAKLDGLAAVASSGSYNDLTNRPTLGNAATRNVGTGANTVAAGDDTRIVNAVRRDTAGQVLTGSYEHTPHDYGNLGSTTITLNPANGLTGKITRTSGSGTIAAPSGTPTGFFNMLISIVGSSNTGSPSLSGFDHVDGDDVPGSGQKAALYVECCPDYKLAVIKGVVGY